MNIAKLADLFFLTACTVVLVAAFELVWDGLTLDAIACFTAVLVNALWVRFMDGRTVREYRR